MGSHCSRSDFEWSYTEEPHRSRRKEILAKHPEVKQLMVSDHRLKYIVTAMVLTQIFTAYMLSNASWVTIVILAYCFGGVINHSMTLAIHEISHNLAFGHMHPWKNRLLAIFGNFIIGVPYAVIFKKYHMEHHKYQGDDERDVDVPSRFEGRFFYNTFTKFLWILLQPFFYSMRPLFLRPKPITHLEVINFSAQITFDLVLLYAFGFRSLAYLIIGTLLAMGLHPVAGHFISEHYIFTKGYETFSYYGPLNSIVFNVGYHNEHHDFPNIPGCNLPKLRKMAPEFYDNLPYHTSWTKVIWDFIFNPDVGPYARTKRRPQTRCGDGDSDKED